MRGQAGGHAQQLLQRESVARRVRRLLRRLQRDGRMVGEGDEDVELLVGRSQPRRRLVDGEDAEQMPVVMAHRHEERVERMPGVVAGSTFAIGHVEVVRDRRPVELASRHDEGAPAVEALRQERRPLLDRASGTEQGPLRRLVAVDSGRLEVVPRGPVHVDRNRPVAERLGDHARDRPEQLGNVVGGADQPSDLEQHAKRRERWKIRVDQRCSPPWSSARTRGPSYLQ